MEKESCDDFRKKLESLQEFPCTYPFKFIVPATSVNKATALFPKGSVSLRHSSGGKYISVSADIQMQNADEVLSIYNKARAIKGIMAL